MSENTLTLEQLREWLQEQGQSWVAESAKHKGEPLDIHDDYQKNMAMAGFFFWIASIIDTGELPT